MAITDKNLIISDFDFNDVKDNFKTFLKGQDEFTDYDFEGSGMNILLDVLAYNTHYLAYNTNMVANEMFLDSAALRRSVVSHAKTLGYTPTSARAASATINVFLSTNLNSATMSSGTTFKSNVDGNDYLFSTTSDISANNRGDGIIEFLNVPIFEGTFITTRYTVNNSNADQRFVIPSNRADTSTVKVQVQKSSTDTTATTYNLATDISSITGTTSSYFLQEVENGQFEVYFGDGIVGKSLENENIVLISYIVTNKEEGNGADTFTNENPIGDVTVVSVSTVDTAKGGGEPESIDSIKLNAPLNYASQGRAVTIEDYKSYIRKLFPGTKSVSVWGGESGSWDAATGQSSTPVYGKVFIAIRTLAGTNLTATQKGTLVKSLEQYSVASITPVIADPDYLYITLNVDIKFNSSVTTKTYTDIISDVRTTITNFGADELEEYGSVFRMSALSTKIDLTDNSITSNTTTLTIQKYFTPDSSRSASYNVNFSNGFNHPYDGYNKAAGGVISSTSFRVSGQTYDMYFDDDGSGILRIYYLVSGVRTYYSSSAGTVDYTTGLVYINPIIISSVVDVNSSVIKISAIPNSNDIIPVRNLLLEIDTTSSLVNANVDTTVVADASGTVTSTGTTSSSSGGVTTGSSSGAY
jgi:hypothetical protein